MDNKDKRGKLNGNEEGWNNLSEVNYRENSASALGETPTRVSPGTISMQSRCYHCKARGESEKIS